MRSLTKSDIGGRGGVTLPVIEKRRRLWTAPFLADVNTVDEKPGLRRYENAVNPNPLQLAFCGP